MPFVFQTGNAFSWGLVPGRLRNVSVITAHLSWITQNVFVWSLNSCYVLKVQRDYFIIPLLHGILKVSRKSGQLITEHAVLESYARLSSTLINEATEGESTLASDFTPTVHNQCSNPHLFTFISAPVLRIQRVCVCLCVFPSRGD